MNKYNVLIGLILLILIGFSCEKQNEIEPINFETNEIIQQLRERDIKKWAETKKLQKEQDESDKAYNKRVKELYDAYWAAIRKMRTDPEHKIVYGWFGGWSATEGMDKSFLTNLPDSVDIVSIWGGIGEFDKNDPKWADLKYAQEVKGLRVLLCWQTGTSGLGLPGGVDAFEKRHTGKNNVEKAVAYAKELTKFIKDHNLNGYDIDWEPTVGNHSGCGNLYYDCNNSSGQGNAAPIRAFIDEMGKNFGPQATTDYNPRGTGTLFLFDGQLEDIAKRFPEKGIYFDYFLEQNYFRTTSGQYGGYVHLIAGYEKRKHIFCDEFEMDGGAINGGVCKGIGGLSCAESKATWVKENGYGGWGAYHIELEYATDYRYTKSVARILNPSDNYKPIIP